MRAGQQAAVGRRRTTATHDEVAYVTRVAPARRPGPGFGDWHDFGGQEGQARRDRVCPFPAVRLGDFALDVVAASHRQRRRRHSRRATALAAEAAPGQRRPAPAFRSGASCDPEPHCPRCAIAHIGGPSAWTLTCSSRRWRGRVTSACLCCQGRLWCGRDCGTRPPEWSVGNADGAHGVEEHAPGPRWSPGASGPAGSRFAAIISSLRHLAPRAARRGWETTFRESRPPGRVEAPARRRYKPCGRDGKAILGRALPIGGGPRVALIVLARSHDSRVGRTVYILRTRSPVGSLHACSQRPR